MKDLINSKLTLALNDLINESKRQSLLIPEESERPWVKERLDDYKSEDKVNELLNNFNNIEFDNGKVKIYRGICRINYESLNNDNVGQAWTFNIDKAYCYGCRLDFRLYNHYYLLYGLVDIDNINWNYTIQKAIHSWNYEKEIVIKENHDLLIYKIDKLKMSSKKFCESYNVEYLSRA